MYFFICFFSYFFSYFFIYFLSVNPVNLYMYLFSDWKYYMLCAYRVNFLLNGNINIQIRVINMVIIAHLAYLCYHSILFM